MVYARRQAFGSQKAPDKIRRQMNNLIENKLFLGMEIPSRDVHELRCYQTWMGDDGIARTVVRRMAEIELEDALENSRVVNGLKGPERFALIIDTRPIKSITKEARDHFSMRGRESRVIGFAILMGSPLSMIIGNFFMGLNKPRVPVKLFTSDENAVKWCKSIVQTEILK